MQEKASRYWRLTWNLGSRYKGGLEFSPGPCIHRLRKPSKILHGKRGEMLKQLHTIFTRSLEKKIYRNMTYLTFFQCLSLFLCINLYGNVWKQFIHLFSDWWGHKKVLWRENTGRIPKSQLFLLPVGCTVFCTVFGKYCVLRTGHFVTPWFHFFFLLFFPSRMHKLGSPIQGTKGFWT